MTVGPAGTVNTNVPPQSFGGVSSSQVANFKEVVNHSIASSTASATPSSQGTEHSQDTSRSFPFVLATRPPINLGNPAGKQGAPLYDTQSVHNAGPQTKAPSPLATPKYEPSGITEALDP